MYGIPDFILLTDEILDLGGILIGDFRKWVNFIYAQVNLNKEYIDTAKVFETIFPINC